MESTTPSDQRSDQREDAMHCDDISLSAVLSEDYEASPQRSCISAAVEDALGFPLVSDYTVPALHILTHCTDDALLHIPDLEILLHCRRGEGTVSNRVLRELIHRMPTLSDPLGTYSGTLAGESFSVLVYSDRSFSVSSAHPMESMMRLLFTHHRNHRIPEVSSVSSQLPSLHGRLWSVLEEKREAWVISEEEYLSLSAVLEKLNDDAASEDVVCFGEGIADLRMDEGRNALSHIRTMYRGNALLDIAYLFHSFQIASLMDARQVMSYYGVPHRVDLSSMSDLAERVLEYVALVEAVDDEVSGAAEPGASESGSTQSENGVTSQTTISQGRRS